jgi:hypothetical protein
VNRHITLASLLLLALAGCASPGGETAAPAPTATATTAAPAPAETAPDETATKTTKAAKPGPKPVTAGESLFGTQYAFVRSADLANRRITFDLVEYYQGKAAVRACRADGEQPAENDWCTGWYIRNNNKRLRTLTVYPDAPLRTFHGDAVDLKAFVATVRDGRLIVFDVDANRIMSAREVHTP